MTKLQKLYFDMHRIRQIELAISREYLNQEMRCPVHLSVGQEATAVGIASLLGPDDLMVGTHRSHAFYLAKGGSLRGLLCELYGKKDGCARGQGGSMHLVDRKVGFSGSTSIVSGTIPVGVGLAFAKKLKKENGRVVICFGDAAIEEGVFHEAANFASLHELPVVFVCENNFYSCYTHLDERQPSRFFSDVAFAHKLTYLGMDGNDCLYIHDWCKSPIETVGTEGPLFIELRTYRHLEHCGPYNDDHLGYRSEAERKFWLQKDPIEKAIHQLKAAGEWTAEFLASLSEIDSEIKFEMDFAKKADFPQAWELGAYEYAKTY